MSESGADSRIGRLSAILAATLALVGAIVGNLQLQASADGAVVGRRAQQLENRQFGSSVRATADLGHQVDLDAVVSEYERRTVFAASAARVANDPTVARQLEAESQVWSEAADAVAALSPVAQQQRADRQEVSRITVQTLDALDRYELGRNASTDRLALQRAAASERAGDFGSRSNAYIGIIAMLAVALFLVGLSLTVTSTHRVWMVRASAALLAIGFAWMVTTATSRVADTPPAAIDAVAEGTKMLRQGDVEAAVRKLDRAIALRSDYAEAYARRFDARRAQAVDFRGGRITGIAIVRDAEMLELAIDDAERALELGYSSSDVPFALAEHYGLQHRYEEALDVNRKATALNPAEPSGWMNEAVFAAARGDAGTAHRAIEESIRLARDRHYVFARADLLAAGRTALDRIATRHPEHRRLVKQLTGELVIASLETSEGFDDVKSIDSDRARLRKQSPPDLALTQDFTVLGGTVGRFVIADAPEGTPFAFLWYTRDSPKDPWVEVVEAISSTAASPLPLEYPDGTTPDVLQFATLDPGACPGSREYRLDVWATDHRLGSILATDPLSDDGELLHVSELIGDADVFNDDVLGIAICQPEGWEITRPAEGVVRVDDPNGEVSVEVTSIPVGDLTEPERRALDQATITRFASELALRGAVAPLDPGAPETFANFETTVGGQPDARAGGYTVTADGTTTFVVMGAWTAPDGVQRTVRIEAVAGRRVGAAYVAEFLTSIRFEPGPLIGAEADEEPEENLEDES